MDNVLRDFEDAVRTTYNRHAQNEPSGYFAEETTKTAIAFAVTNNFYSGFTRQNDARSKAMELGKDNIIYALLYNAISLMDMIHQSGMSLGNVDSYLMYSEDVKLTKLYENSILVKGNDYMYFIVGNDAKTIEKEINVFYK